jgi:hypothetical protein
LDRNSISTNLFSLLLSLTNKQPNKQTNRN